MLRIFDRQEDLRANRARARIKFLIDRVGIDEFRSMVDEELEGDWVNERDFDPDPLLFIDDEQANAPAQPLNPSQPERRQPRVRRSSWPRTCSPRSRTASRPSR